ncbi:MAG: DedA family protein [Gemmatimonadetes bacterium]|nr:DedA family protein [Gemmatimonadota bacterium]
MLRPLYNWVLHWAKTPYGVLALLLIAIAESSVFPVPPDPLLIALCIAIPAKSYRFAILCAVGSVIGGAIGYFIGHGFWEVAGPWFFEHIPGFSEHKFAKVGDIYDKYNFWFVLVAGFTPIPYKIFSIGAGVFQINFVTFILASIVGRSARFFLVAGLIHKFGEPITEFIDKYFNILSIVFIILLIGGFYLIKFVLH